MKKYIFYTLALTGAILTTSCADDSDMIDTTYIIVTANYQSDAMGETRPSDKIIPNDGRIEDNTGVEIDLAITLHPGGSKWDRVEIKFVKKILREDEENVYEDAIPLPGGLFSGMGTGIPEKIELPQITIEERLEHYRLTIDIHDNVWGVTQYSMKIIEKPLRIITIEN